jgi:hypothetical protein
MDFERLPSSAEEIVAAQDGLFKDVPRQKLPKKSIAMRAKSYLLSEPVILLVSNLFKKEIKLWGIWVATWRFVYRLVEFLMRPLPGSTSLPARILRSVASCAISFFILEIVYFSYSVSGVVSSNQRRYSDIIREMNTVAGIGVNNIINVYTDAFKQLQNRGDLNMVYLRGFKQITVDVVNDFVNAEKGSVIESILKTVSEELAILQSLTYEMSKATMECVAGLSGIQLEFNKQTGKSFDIQRDIIDIIDSAYRKGTTNQISEKQLDACFSLDSILEEKSSSKLKNNVFAEIIKKIDEYAQRNGNLRLRMEKSKGLIRSAIELENANFISVNRKVQRDLSFTRTLEAEYKLWIQPYVGKVGTVDYIFAKTRDLAYSPLDALWNVFRPPPRETFFEDIEASIIQSSEFFNETLGNDQFNISSILPDEAVVGNKALSVNNEFSNLFMCFGGLMFLILMWRKLMTYSTQSCRTRIEETSADSPRTPKIVVEDDDISVRSVKKGGRVRSRSKSRTRKN